MLVSYVLSFAHWPLRQAFDPIPAQRLLVAARVRHVTNDDSVELSSGETVEKIASLEASRSTRSAVSLRCVLEKTGCHRQAEVVALLSGIAVQPG